MTPFSNSPESGSSPQLPSQNAAAAPYLSPNGVSAVDSDRDTVDRTSLSPSVATEVSASRPFSTFPFGSGETILTRPSTSGVVLVAIGVMLVGLSLGNFWLALAGSIVALLVSLRVIWFSLRPIVYDLVSRQQWTLSVSLLGILIAGWGILGLSGINQAIVNRLRLANWDAVGALGEVFGALGQILIAVLAVYVAWRQYVIEKELTTQQNLITQQQTIDSYFQGVSDLVLDPDGLLEDWPQERAIAEARTAAILGSVDAGGKAKIIRFLSRANLLTPLLRDQRLGRAILDGAGGYAEDRTAGIRVIDLGIMLARANLSGTDLRWTDLSEANLIRANLSNCDLVRTNLARTILLEASLREADLKGTRFFYGNAENASPRSQTEPPNYTTGEYTGAVIENADFTGSTPLSPEQRYYCCAWGGSKTRTSIPGGCEGIPNKLGR